VRLKLIGTVRAIEAVWNVIILEQLDGIWSIQRNNDLSLSFTPLCIQRAILAHQHSAAGLLYLLVKDLPAFDFQ
jgi:hypothetical protein